MEIPTAKTKLKRLLLSIERLVSYSKNVALSAGLLTLVSGQSTAQIRVPVDPKLSIQKATISKFAS